MTIEQKAREIAVDVVGYDETTYHFSDVMGAAVMGAARLGIIEGLEMAAKVAEQWNENSPYNSRAAAIRALIEEQK